ncbi:MAG: uracil-DNA glycosylase [Desulfurococcales archaeon]|jgi:DNA polymerase|nr:uracil-DNA glycosylase [Desulfurococcales archaeon]
MSTENVSEKDEWRDLIEEIKKCRRCPLHQNRTNAVPGEGSVNSDIMIIGEAPGANEDLSGRPFVGAAGTLLRKILREIGFDEEKIYITNVVKCRPPGNRKPNKDEIDACSPYLRRQIIYIKPKIIIALGNVAGEWIFREAGLQWDSISRNRGRIYEANLYGMKISVIPSFHPSAVIRGSVDEDILRKDLLLAKSLLENEKKIQRKPLSLYDFLKK